ncbi:MAG: helicase-related protein [Blastomonas sp.]
MTRFSRSSVTAVLGPTNTGKTHLAIERFCAHSSGLMGFPLRLLAREVYDRVVAIKGPGEVALLTGEERIEPPGARWYLATAESMPVPGRASAAGGGEGRDFSFVAIDEAQLGAHPERGHVFTDRMLRARGRDETMILGSQSLEPLVRALVDDAEIISRPRFSTLSYAGARKLSRLPPRSAIIAFSAEEVYAVAEMLRRLRGGAAVVMGALSPATRNAQVAMYQAGEVDYLVATDAIGMGLNLDVDHVAFAALAKFDGQKRRRLQLAEMAQIAGRAGRHQRDGSFGTVVTGGGGAEFTPEEIERIEAHEFPPLDALFWRNASPRFDSLDMLIGDLDARPQHERLRAAPEAIDLAVLRRLAGQPGIAERVRGSALVERFWAACSLPDFEKRAAEHHAALVAGLWQHLGRGNGHIPVAMVARRIADLDNVQGDVERLGARIAAIRTWAYVAQRRDWLADPGEMAERARAVEGRLSDALHKALTQRFVDRRTAVLLRGLGQDAALLPVRLGEDDTVLVDGEPIGRLSGFRFEVDGDARLADRKMLLAAAERHLPGLLAQRARALLADDPQGLSLEVADGSLGLMWRGHAIGRVVRGRALLAPRFMADRALGALPDSLASQISRHGQHWIDRHIARHLDPLVRIDRAIGDPHAPGELRALLAGLVDAGGVVARLPHEARLARLDAGARKALRRLGVVLGSLDIHVRAMIAPGPQGLFAALDNLWRDAPVPLLEGGGSPLAPVTARPVPGCAYRRCGSQLVRIDLAEKLLRGAHDRRKGPQAFAIDPARAVSMGLKPENHEKLLFAAGFRKAGKDDGGVQLWRWRGLGKAAGKAHGKPRGKHAGNGSNASADGAAQKPAPAISADHPFAALAEIRHGHG